MLRSALERRESILSILRVRRFSTCADLAREFEVTVRTIYRDIGHLILNHDIRTEPGAAGGIYYDGKPDSRQEYLTPFQIDALNKGIVMNDELREAFQSILLGFAPKSKNNNKDGVNDE